MRLSCESTSSDFFGLPRQYPHFWVRSGAQDKESGASLLRAYADAVTDLASRTMRGEVYIDCGSDSQADWLDSYWPVFLRPKAGLSAQRWRRVIRTERAPDPESASSRDEAGREEMERRIASLRAMIGSVATDVVEKTGFKRRYASSDATPVGSTAHGTFVSPEVDFDVVISTAVDQSDIPHGELTQCCDSIAAAVAAHGEFADYCSWAWNAPRLPLTRVSAGLRGTRSFVARYAVTRKGSEAAFLDLNLGRLQRMLELETSISGYFRALPSKWARTVCREIRTAKSTLQRIPGLCGSEVKGLKSHHIEQLVVQCGDLRSSGLPVGTFANAMSFLVEEAKREGRLDCDFATWRQRFPLWHPGSMALAPDDPGQWVNLWNEVGGSNASVGEEKWRLLLGAASRLSISPQDSSREA